jgi:hypothetical protein
VANEQREARFMVLAIERGLMPSLKRSLQGKAEEVMMQARLDADTTDDLPLGSTRLIFQKKVVLEEEEVGVDGEIALTKMDEDINLKNGVWIEMD